MERKKDIQFERLQKIRQLHTENLKKIQTGAEKRKEKPLKQIEAQITVKHTYPVGEYVNDRQIQCKVGYNTVRPYVSFVPKQPSTAQDTFWGDLKTRAIPGLVESLDSFTFYKNQSDFELNLEYSKWGFFTGTSLVYQDVFDTAQPLDNVLIEEYEIEYGVRVFFFSRKITVICHKIVKIERGGQVIFPFGAGTKISPESGKPQSPSPHLETTLASGTGFFISNEGHLLTCYHVVKGGREINITAFDGKNFSVRLIQSDPANDVALLKVDAITKSLPLSDSSALAKGDEVLTLGYPLIGIQGQDQKATFGRINSVSGIQGDIRLLQIDVPIQPGNSGGPLITRRGEVVGMVISTLDYFSTVMATGVSPQNVNYAIKSDYVIPLLRTCLKDLIDKVVSDAVSATFPEIVKRSEPCVALITVK